MPDAYAPPDANQSDNIVEQAKTAHGMSRNLRKEEWIA
jgi:hypothetical protein